MMMDIHSLDGRIMDDFIWVLTTANGWQETIEFFFSRPGQQTDGVTNQRVTVKVYLLCTCTKRSPRRRSAPKTESYRSINGPSGPRHQTAIVVLFVKF
jgi:hypothetical protein